MPPVLFALGFANLPMLAGIGAASIPIIIHLLNRRKFREVHWAAMRFLLAAIRKNYRRVRLEQLLLLAVRTLLILLVVGAMAKPFLESVGAVPVLAGRRTHRVIVLDGSLSMAYKSQGVSRFERAKQVATQLVKEARRGDTVSVVLMGDPPRVVIGDPSPNHDEVNKEIGEITLSHGGTDLAASFQAVNRVLDVAPSIPQKEVIVLTDLQAASWNKTGSPGEALKRAVTKLSTYKPRSVLIDLGSRGDENRAVTDLRLDTPIVTMGSTPALTATVRNFGRKDADGLRVRFIIDGQTVHEETVPVKSGEEEPVSTIPTFVAPGDHLVEVLIDDDPLPLDNHRWLSVPVREFVNVLLVDGDIKAVPFESETDYLAAALNPTAGSPGAVSPIRVEVIPESQLAQRDLSPYDAVALCNLDQFNGDEVASLDAYLKQGGGLVVFGGDRVHPENYNRLLFADGKGISPAEFGPSVGDAARKTESKFGFDPIGYTHPIIEAFAGVPDAVQSGLTGTKTWQYHKLKLPKNTSARVALRFDTGDPAVIESKRHRGTVMLVATSADDDWSSWPLHQSFPPVMEQVVLRAASGRQSERNVRVGQPLDQALPANGADAAVTVTNPSGKAFPTKLRADGDVSRLFFEDTDLSGAYQVKIGPPLALESVFAADPDPAESDPAKLDEAGLKAAVPGWSFAYLDDWLKLTRSASAVARRGELHRQLLYGVLILLIVESLMAWKFGHHASTR